MRVEGDEVKNNYKASFERGEYDKALQQCLGLLDSMHDPNERAELEYYIGKCYYKKENFKEALEFYERVLINSKGKNASLESNCYNEMGSVFYKERKLDQAIKYINYAMDCAEPNSMDEALAYNNMGRIFYQRKEYPMAQFYFQYSLVIKKKNIPLDDLEMSVSYNNLGLVYMELGVFDKALRYLEVSLSIRIKKMQYDHPDIGTTYNNIALIYLRMNKYDDAREAFNKALEIRINTLGEQHLDTLMTYYGIGMMYFRMEEYRTAYKVYEHVVHILSKNNEIDRINAMGILSEMNKCEKKIEEFTSLI